jgi:hypothetical protein
MIPEILTRELEALRERGYFVEALEAEGYIQVLFHGYKLPAAYTKTSTELLVKLPMSYPNGRPDMFWTDVDLGLNGKDMPNQSNVIETILGKKWRRFSWHPQNWNPGRDNLTTYLEFVNSGIAKAAKL